MCTLLEIQKARIAGRLGLAVVASRRKINKANGNVVRA